MIRIVVLTSLAAAAISAGAAFAAGNPASGKKVYLSNGCGSCHAFKPAGSKGTVGPALTRARLTADAKRAKQPYTAFIRTSIVLPKQFVAPGYKALMPSYSKLSKKQVDDLVAFIAAG